jgi:hypothetical protein
LTQFFAIPFQKLNNFLFCKICGYKKDKTTNFFPSPLSFVFPERFVPDPTFESFRICSGV